MEIIKKIEKEARAYFKGSKGSHGWDHTKRVYNLCIHIGKKEKADLNVLKLAALLHDIARKKEDESGGKICHAKEGALLAEKILQKHNLKKKLIENVVHSIAAHRFRNNLAPQTLEAKILFDADKLDSIGAIGIGRTFLFAGEIGARLHNKGVDLSKTKPYTEEDTAYREFTVKLKKIYKRMLTHEGKRLAKERHDFMVEFFRRLDREVEGKL